MKVAVIIPFRNEAPRIASVVNGIPSWIDFIVAVDDASTDGGMPPYDSRLTTLRNTVRLGVGGAIMNGHMEAKKQGSDVDVVMAGDGQMDPKYLPKLLDAISLGYDYAKGNRFMEPGYERGMPIGRIIGNRLHGLTMKLVSGYWRISDPHNGYTALRTSTLGKLETWHIWKGYFFESDMLIHLKVANAKVRDVAIPARYGDEESGVINKEFTFLSILLVTQRLFWRLRNSQ